MTRPSHLRALTIAALLVALFAVQVSPAAAQRAKTKVCPNADSEPGQASEGQLAFSAACLVNNERSKRGLVRLRLNKRLSEAADEHTEDMVQKHYFEHTSPSGGNVVDRLLPTGYLRRAIDWLVGENLAWGTEELSTPRRIVRAWMQSPGHRHNILTRKFREIGVGVVFAAPTARGHVAATYTQVFGYKRSRR